MSSRQTIKFVILPSLPNNHSVFVNTVFLFAHNKIFATYFRFISSICLYGSNMYIFSECAIY